MKAFAALVVTALLAAAAGAQPAGKDKPAPKLKFTVSKETTYVTGPLDKDGYVDFVAALNERLGKGVTPESNANVLIWKALGPRPGGEKGMPAEFFKRLGIDEPPAEGDYFVGLRPFLRDRLGIADPASLTAIDEQLTQALRGPWTAADHPQLAEWLAANEKPLAVVREGLKRPHYYSPLVPSGGAGRPPLISANLAGVQACRGLATALAARALLRAGEGKPADGWADVLACQRLGRLLGRGGMLIEGLVAYACDAIGQRAAAAFLDRPDLDARQLIGFLRDVRALPPMPALADRLSDGERLFFLDGFAFTIRNGPGALQGLGANVNLPAGVDIDWDPALRKANRMFDRMTTALRDPDRARRQAELGKIETELKDIQKARKEAAAAGMGPFSPEGATPQAVGEVIGDILISLLMPAIQKVQEAAERTEQGARNLHVGLALAAYQRDHKAYPKALADLAPKYLDRVPDDVFTGKPLVYQPTETGFLLYSLGPNGKDDEGRWFDDVPRGDDPSVRVPRPKKK